jgi:hypothetical protein
MGDTGAHPVHIPAATVPPFPAETGAQGMAAMVGAVPLPATTEMAATVAGTMPTAWDSTEIRQRERGELPGVAGGMMDRGYLCSAKGRLRPRCVVLVGEEGIVHSAMASLAVYALSGDQVVLSPAMRLK